MNSGGGIGYIDDYSTELYKYLKYLTKKGEIIYMAEAILSRSTFVLEDILDPIPVTSTTHGIKVTLKAYTGEILAGYPISCRDGNTSYSYTTNEKGQTIFSVSSGAANIYVGNNVNGYTYIDMQPQSINVDAPVGLTTRLNISLNEINYPNSSSFLEFNSQSNDFRVIRNHNTHIILVGGGGGGGTGHNDSDDDYDYHVAGQGGGSGYMNQYNYRLEKNNNYKFIVGYGGGGGRINSTTQSGYNNGNAGGTSYIVNTNMSAAGGRGGSPSKYLYGTGWKISPAIGGLGNSGWIFNGMPGVKDYNQINMINGENSPVNFAGGGGAGAYTGYYSYLGTGGSPYGGNTMESGSRGGGGGGGFNYGNRNGGSGGWGLMRVDFFD